MSRNKISLVVAAIIVLIAAGLIYWQRAKIFSHADVTSSSMIQLDKTTYKPGESIAFNFINLTGSKIPFLYVIVFPSNIAPSDSSGVTSAWLTTNWKSQVWSKQIISSNADGTGGLTNGDHWGVTWDQKNVFTSQQVPEGSYTAIYYITTTAGLNVGTAYLKSFNITTAGAGYTNILNLKGIPFYTDGKYWTVANNIFYFFTWGTYDAKPKVLSYDLSKGSDAQPSTLAPWPTESTSTSPILATTYNNDVYLLVPSHPKVSETNLAGYNLKVYRLGADNQWTQFGDALSDVSPANPLNPGETNDNLWNNEHTKLAVSFETGVMKEFDFTSGKWSNLGNYSRVDRIHGIVRYKKTGDFDTFYGFANRTMSISGSTASNVVTRSTPNYGISLLVPTLEQHDDSYSAVVNVRGNVYLFGSANRIAIDANNKIVSPVDHMNNLSEKYNLDNTDSTVYPSQRIGSFVDGYNPYSARYINGKIYILSVSAISGHADQEMLTTYTPQ